MAVGRIPGRRRRWDNFGEPLFAEDWWVADQKLFEDSLIRQQPSSSGSRRRSARAGTIRKRKRPAPSGLVQDMLPGFGEEQGADDGEPVRGDGPQALGTVAAGPVRANLAALSVLRTAQREHRLAMPAEQEVLARWSGWGAVPEVFDDRRAEFAWAREQLAVLLSPAELAAARRSTLNAHYTDAALV